MNQRFRVIAVTTLIIVTIDHATKYWAWLTLRDTPPQAYFDNMLRLSFHENPGAFLSLGADWPPAVRIGIFIGLTSLFLIYLFYYLMTDELLNRASIYFGGMMLAGGIGNLIDRMFFENGVIDFLNVGVGNWRTGIFNVADMAIMVGVFGMLLFGRPVEEAALHPAEPAGPTDGDLVEETVNERFIDDTTTIEPEN